MSIVPVIAATAATAAANAAAARQKVEEEQMTTYNSDDLNGWEFKIMRSTLGRFNSRAAVEQVCAGEAAAGWELVEKFDDHRLRMKRRVERRSNDHLVATDPYRTSVGSSISASTGIATGLVLLLVGLGLFLFMNASGSGFGFDLSASPLLLISILLPALALVAVVLKRRG